MSPIPEWRSDEPADPAVTDGETAQRLPTQPPFALDIADAVAAELDALADRPLAEHPEAYERIHARLQESLAEIDDA